ncbi:electron transfer flavoprotein subunit alpha/FixB family protein [Chloroflexota bacterium]
MSKGSEVWVWAEQRNGRLMSVSLELLGKGLELSQALEAELAAVLIGNEVEEIANELLAYGANKVYLVEDQRLELYQSGAYAGIMADLIGENNPQILLLGATAIGMDLAPRVAAKVKTGLTAHCVDLYFEEIDGISQLVAAVPGWGGNFMIKIVCPERRPQMITVKPGVMEKPVRLDKPDGSNVRVKPDIKEKDFRAKVTDIVESKPSGVPLEEADVVVAGGWGLQSVGGFGLVEELTAILDGAVGGTRPALDEGWIPEEKLIGSSGKTVSPSLFISVGASGAMYFTAGFLKSKVIMAIDQNPKAPIFEVTDVGIVGDLAKIVPCLMDEFRLLLK